MQSDEIVARVWERVRANRRVLQLMAPRVTEEAWYQTEASIGFSLPPLLRHLYFEVGNGGFGPGYGLRGAIGGAKDDNGWDLVGYYRLWFEEPPESPAWKWPRGLVGLNDWGCAIVSCVDCRDPSFPMIGFDPNVLDVEEPASWQRSFVSEGMTFDEWIGAWAAGTPLKQPEGRMS